jgi:HD-GYP domain-containing protein (c-di-GMP phosphodiesterase class II)
MTLLATTDSEAADAVRLLSAVGDVFGGHPIGFSLRVAHVAARFASYCQFSPDAIAATFYAAALHRIGAVRIMVPRDAGPRSVEIARWDDPPAGAAIVAAAGVFPAATADVIRWHREAFDGTGFPDQLRWNGIPETAMAVNIARAFVEAGDAHGERGSAGDAVFMLEAESGCVFAIAALRHFREFLGAQPDTYDAPFEPAWALRGIDGRALIGEVCDAIDGRQPRTTGRGERIERIVRAILLRLEDARIDPEQAVFAGRLTALARTGQDGGADDIFTLSRLGLESRAEQASRAALILAAAPAFGPFAAIVGATEEWYDGSGLPGRYAGEAIDPVARVLAVAIAAEAVTAGDARRRIRAAAGSRLDPAIVAAYIASAEAGR